MAFVASSASSVASSSTTDSRCKTCFLKLDSELAQWKDVFVCHLPSVWNAVFLTRMFNDVLKMASPGGAQQVTSVFLVPRVDAQELQHGFVNMSSHEAACFIVNELGKSLFQTCGAYVGAHLNKENLRLYLNLVMEQRETVEQYVMLSRAEHLERLTREQRLVIDTLVHDAQVAQKRINGLEYMLMQQQGRVKRRLLPKM